MLTIRKRNSLLSSLDYLRDKQPALGLFHVISFLYICENEGLNVAELAQVIDTTRATASRNARALTAPDHEGTLAPSLGWIEILTNPHDARGRVLRLTETGRQVRDHLDQLIGLAQPIAQAPTPERGHG